MLERWKLLDFASGEGVTNGAQTVGFNDHDWLSISAPGDVHRTLVDAGRIPDPFWDRNETACAWMESREWWYRTGLDAEAEMLASGDRLDLVFQGLDTFATIWLNGRELGRSRNMFREARFDVTHLLQPGQNTVAVCFAPPLDCIPGEPLTTWGRNPERVAMRKAQFGYGWDWGPRLPTIGIWRPVELVRSRVARLVGMHFATVELSQAGDRALVAIRVEAERVAPDAEVAIMARAQLTDPDGRLAGTVDISLAGSSTDTSLVGTAYVAVDAPRLWWTHDLGDPALYTLDVALLAGAEPVAASALQVGIRTLSLDQSPDPIERGARFFRFILNGVPVFARGANWIPADSFVGAIEPERYAGLLEAARDANMTMLRVWGGGIWEHDGFYAECDRLGLLVWQDFMFACAMYPEDDPTFVAEVESEATYQVQRLRSHPSLALWCGNNENQWLHDRTFWDREQPPAYGALYYDTILPAVVAAHDGRTPYWPGSPYGGNDYNGPEDGDVHNWEVWHGNFPRRFGEKPRRETTPENVSFLRYAEDHGRFISEFGMHAAPALSTLARCIPSDQMYHHSPALDWHNKDTPKNKGDNLMLTVTGLPSDLTEYVDFSQLAQAEGLTFGIEHFRRRTPHCSGALVWQLNDCWPVLSWSVLDYYGVPKAGYYYLRRVFAPVLASFKRLADDSVELWVTNNRREAFSDNLVVRLATFAGDVIFERTCAAEVAAGHSQVVASWSAQEIGPSLERYLWVEAPSGGVPANRVFFGAIKDLRRPQTTVRMAVRHLADGAVAVDVEADPRGYALFVNLSSEAGLALFDDNFFDLPAGQRRTLRLVRQTQAEPIDPATLQVRWR